jgi:hypothetical protein
VRKKTKTLRNSPRWLSFSVLASVKRTRSVDRKKKRKKLREMRSRKRLRKNVKNAKMSVEERKAS